MQTVLDKIGQPITEGCYIAYPIMVGQSVGTRVGKVLKVESEYTPATPARFDNGRQLGWGWGERTDYKLTIWGIDDEHPSLFYASLLNARSYLHFPSRIIVLDTEKLPALYYELLAPVTLESTKKTLAASIERKRRDE